MKKRLLKYIKILGRGVVGISIELVYPLIVTISAFLICLIIFSMEMISR
jgi:hypothetical protein